MIPSESLTTRQMILGITDYWANDTIRITDYWADDTLIMIDY